MFKEEKDINKELSTLLDEYQDSNNKLDKRIEILKYLQLNDVRQAIITDKNLGRIFEVFSDIADAKDEDFPKSLTMEELYDIHPSFKTTNGCSWARRDIGYLGKHYRIETKRNGKGVTEIVVTGKKEQILDRTIDKSIYDFYKGAASVVFGERGDIEIDHKDGRYEDPDVMCRKTQTPDMFQPLTKKQNMIKRQHCKVCRETKKRFDARTLGYSCGWINGDENFDEIKIRCDGCYLNDIIKFRREISNSFTTLKKKNEKNSLKNFIMKIKACIFALNINNNNLN